MDRAVAQALVDYFAMPNFDHEIIQNALVGLFYPDTEETPS